ncbi:MAG: Dabb family protein [Gammaproteobacteria bacterium]|nr:Dabb family protein [Gammaproteobacteria bacterium]
MDAYLTHPAQVTLVNQTLKSLVAKIRVFDFR